MVLPRWPDHPLAARKYTRAALPERATACMHFEALPSWVVRVQPSTLLTQIKMLLPEPGRG
eukprot:1496694-Alexandrium_andersonii.AAC.1